MRLLLVYLRAELTNAARRAEALKPLLPSSAAAGEADKVLRAAGAALLAWAGPEIDGKRGATSKLVRRVPAEGAFALYPICAFRSE